MLQYEELRQKLEELKPDIDDLSSALGLDQLRVEADELNQRLPIGFWDDMDAAQAVLRRTSELKATINNYENLVSMYNDAETLIQLADEEQDGAA